MFGPQKGVQPAQVALLDGALAHFAGVLEQALGRHAADQPGAGAAGGLGYALLMLGAQFRSGAETVADHIGLDEA
ncbi:glycerate kinase, partial [Acinetobacter baumannii]